MEDRNFSVLKEKLIDIKSMGWIPNHRPGNVGGVGNTLEDLLGVAENNLQLPDFGEWELKSQRKNTNSLLTLFHCEPEPRSAKIVTNVLLPLYGWPHPDAGSKYPETEKSFRQTITTGSFSSRGFIVNVDRKNERITISFEYSAIQEALIGWQQEVPPQLDNRDIEPTPYWTFKSIEEKLDKKLKNMVYVTAETKSEDGQEYFRYTHIEAHAYPTLSRFLKLLDEGQIYVDFDARTGHNHGTKFRIRPSEKTSLYEYNFSV